MVTSPRFVECRPTVCEPWAVVQGFRGCQPRVEESGFRGYQPTVGERCELWAVRPGFPGWEPWVGMAASHGLWSRRINGVKPVITPEETARLDAAAVEAAEVLMERAGLGVALAAVDMGVGYGSHVVILAGKGNNGGDGYVAARYLARRGVDVTVQALGASQDETSPAGHAAARAAAAGVRINALADPVPADLVIDALFGVGFHGTLPDVIAPWTGTPHPVLAVDVPSGLDAASGAVAGPAFTAHRTVTFHSLKPGHLLGEGPERCGSISIVDIGLSGGNAELLLCEEVDAPRPPRLRTSHKWSAGSVAVVGGSPGLTGAAMLAATAALHGGAGSVAVVCPGALQSIYAGMSAGVMTRGVGDADRFRQGDVPATLEEASRFDVMVLGPGLGRGHEAFVDGLLTAWDKPLLIDADGINALAGADQLAARTTPTIITPHAGEFARLTGAQADYRSAATLAAGTGAVVVLKGNPTFVLGAERSVVASGGAELATIGTGDVLAGFMAALWSRGLSAEVAARSAAYWHGRAGAELAETGTVTADVLSATIGRYAW